jgi:hypothetical protein
MEEVEFERRKGRKRAPLDMIAARKPTVIVE